jgi:hypothetical protein
MVIVIHQRCELNNITAIEDILSEGGVSQVLKFASTVSKADLVGEVMADLDQPEFDAALLPALQ